ncbi:MAG: hypothetical protein EXS35_10555 [Pedosphaera sp.]|nr:hypothetical protein [Pedosphaera sp.]
MKTILLLALLAFATTRGAFAQGTISLGNGFSGFRAPIYDYFPGNPLSIASGQSSLGIPSGSVAYTGQLLQGTGFTFAVFYGATTVTDPNQLTLLAATTFRTATANVLPAGLIYAFDVIVPGIAAGGQAKLEVRVWDNVGGSITSWNQNNGSANRSGTFLSLPLGGTDSTGNIFLSPNMTGWTSFNIPQGPEPGPLLLTGLGGAMLFLFRWQNRRRV